jgi:hypothetical protein
MKYLIKISWCVFLHDQNCGCLVAVSLWLQVGKKGFCLLTEGIIITATMWETMLGKGFKVSKW